MDGEAYAGDLVTYFDVLEHYQSGKVDEAIEIIRGRLPKQGEIKKHAGDWNFDDAAKYFAAKAQTPARDILLAYFQVLAGKAAPQSVHELIAKAAG